MLKQATTWFLDFGRTAGVGDYSWSSLRRLAGLPWVKSSYVWFAIVPVAAYLLQELKSPISLRVGTYDIVVPIGLPFSWTMFYFGALCFATGSMIFLLRCPEVIRDFKSFQHFQTEGRGMPYLFYAYGAHLTRRWQQMDNKELADAIQLNCLAEYLHRFTNANVSMRMTIEELFPIVDALQVSLVSLPFRKSPVFDPSAEDDRGFEASDMAIGFKEEKLAEAYWYVRLIDEQERPVAMWVTYALYSVGLGLHLIVLAQGFWYVSMLSLKPFLG